MPNYQCHRHPLQAKHYLIVQSVSPRMKERETIQSPLTLNPLPKLQQSIPIWSSKCPKSCLSPLLVYLNSLPHSVHVLESSLNFQQAEKRPVMAMLEQMISKIQLVSILQRLPLQESSRRSTTRIVTIARALDKALGP